MPKIKRSLVLLFTFVLLLASIQIAYGEEETGSWETKASMLVGRDSFSAATVNGKIYAIGGKDKNGYSNKVEEYDPIADTWTLKADMCEARWDFGLAEVNGKIYVIGGNVSGCTNSSIVEEYDPITDTWTTKKDMPTARCAEAVEVNGKIYVVGGHDGSKYLKIVEEYDPITDTWTTKEDMPTARNIFSMAQANGKIYAIGGARSGKFLDIVEEYDPTTNTWTRKESMYNPKGWLEAIGYNGKVYAIGGRYKDDIKNNFEVYNPEINKWTTKKGMIGKRAGFATVELGGVIYAIGGMFHLNTVEAYTLPQSPTPAPINLTATGGDSKVTLNWNEVSNCDSYNVYRSTTSGEPYDLESSSVTTSPYIDFDVENDTTYYYVVTAVKSGVESEYSNEASATAEPSGIILDIEPEKETIKLNETVTADLVIDNINEIAAEDISINYDNQKLEFLGFEEIDEIKLVKAIEYTDSGNLRVILASKGEANIVHSKKILLKLKFKGIETGEAVVDITKGRVTDGIEMEKDLKKAQCDQATIIIEEIIDVNNTGEFTLIDLGIDARHLFKNPSDPELTQYNTDIVVNNAIDEDDLLEIGRLLLENPNYTPNI